MISDVKYIHSRKNIYQMEKCSYVVSQNGEVTSSKKRNRKIEILFNGIESGITWKDQHMRKRYYNYDLEK